MKPLLVADSIAKSYGSRRVLTSATLRAFAGRVSVLLGRNGVGKSTLLKIAAGRLQPDSGVVRFAGRSRLTARLPQLAREGLFYLADEDLFSATYTVRRQLEFLRASFGGGSVVAAAERAGIAHALDRRPHALSGGERRRAELAAVIVRRPTCLLADEPFRGIDPKDAEDLGGVFRELASGDCAVIVSGHEVPTLLALADQVTWCTSGTTYELGSPDEARNHETFRREYLGPLGA